MSISEVTALMGAFAMVLTSIGSVIRAWRGSTKVGSSDSDG
jgi:hypothetical protein